jgi:hypothetical protein
MVAFSLLLCVDWWLVAVQLEDEEGRLRYYVEPVAIDALPFGVSAGKFVEDMECGVRGLAHCGPRVVGVMSEVSAFLESDHRQLMVVYGEAGVGKSTFLWSLGKLIRANDHGIGVGVRRVPVYVELKGFSAETLAGGLLRALKKAGVANEAIKLNCEELHTRVQVVLLCDGLDELQGGVAGMTDIVTLLCGGSRWEPSVLKVLVTCRGNMGDDEAMFGQHSRLVFLPFSSDQVRESPLTFNCMVLHSGKRGTRV